MANCEAIAAELERQSDQRDRPCEGRRDHNVALWLCAVLTWAYLYSALIPFELDWGQWRWEAARDSMSWTPFRDREGDTPWEQFSRSDAVVNFAVGVPLGWLGFLGLRRMVQPSGAWLLATLLATVTAMGMEWLQLLAPSARVSTMTDVVTITAGGGCGALAAWLIGRRLIGWLRFVVLPILVADKARLALALALGFLAVRSFFPDNLAWSVSEWKKSLGQANVIPGEFPHRHLVAQLRLLGLEVGSDRYEHIRTWPNLTGAQYACGLAGHVLLYGLIGGAIAAASRSTHPVAVPAVGLGVGVLAAAVEVVQIFFPSQAIDVNSALAGCVGGSTGAATWIALRERPRLLRFVCLAVVLGYIASQYLRPGKRFATGTALDVHALVPLYYYQRGSDSLDIFLDIIQSLALFLPVGWWVADGVRPDVTQSRAYGVAVAMSAVVAIVFELLQTAAGRTPSIDDVLWAAVGGWLGARLAAMTRQRGGIVKLEPR